MFPAKLGKSLASPENMESMAPCLISWIWSSRAQATRHNTEATVLGLSLSLRSAHSTGQQPGMCNLEVQSSEEDLSASSPARSPPLCPTLWHGQFCLSVSTLMLLPITVATLKMCLFIDVTTQYRSWLLTLFISGGVPRPQCVCVWGAGSVTFQPLPTIFPHTSLVTPPRSQNDLA